MEIAFLFSAVLLLIVAAMHSTAVESAAVFNVLGEVLEPDKNDNGRHKGHHR